MDKEPTAITSVAKRFEDLVAWQKARHLSASIYRASGQGRFGRDYALKDQIRRAAVSVMSNIAEGFERGRDPEFHHFLCIAKASCAEVRSQLYVAFDAELISKEIFEHLLHDATEVANIVGGLRAAVERRRSST